MSVIAAFNCINDYSPTLGTTTSGAYFDTTRVDYGMVLSDNVSYVQLDPHTESSVDATWYHFGLWYDTGGVNDTGGFFQWVDASNDVICGFDITDGYGFYPRVYGDTTVTGAKVAMTQALHSLDVKITVTASDITMDVYVAKVLASTATVTNATASKGKPVKLNPTMADVIYSSGFAFVISEVIVAETDTRDMRMKKREMDADGFHVDFVGGYENVADENETTFVVAAANGEQSSFTMPAYSSASSIVAVVLSARAAKHGTTPANMRQGFRIGGVDYDGDQVAAGDNLENKIAVFENNPATSLPWTDTEISGAEAMLKAET